MKRTLLGPWICARKRMARQDHRIEDLPQELYHSAWERSEFLRLEVEWNHFGSSVRVIAHIDGLRLYIITQQSALLLHRWNKPLRCVSDRDFLTLFWYVIPETNLSFPDRENGVIFPIPTPRAGWYFVPRWRMIMLPGLTACLPKHDTVYAE